MNAFACQQSILRRLPAVIAVIGAGFLFTDSLRANDAPTNSAPSITSAPPVRPAIGGTNAPHALSKEQLFDTYREQLEKARFMRTTATPKEAEPILLDLLAEGKPELIQQSALLELANVVQAENDLPRAESILAQFLFRWPNDPRAPEVLLKQGETFRQMGLNNLALAKFYSVMTAALALRTDQTDYYRRLVFNAQSEIAETHYQMGKFADAAEFFSRLLKQNDPELNRPQTQFRLVRSLAATGHPIETAVEAQEFLSHYNDAPQQPEVRFYLAQALKQSGRNSDALQQVLLLLQEQKARTKDQPDVWAYWQQRAGNEIANQLYHEGDYPKALDVYLSLSQLDASPAWQLPVYYQVGITYERLLQPAKAIDTYNQIVGREKDLGTNASPGLKAIVDMARWRVGFLQWQTKAEAESRSLGGSFSSADISTNAASTTLPQ